MDNEIFSSEVPMPKGKRGKLPPPLEVKQKRKYTRKMKNEPTVPPERVGTKTETSSPEQESELSEVIQMACILAAATEYFGPQALKTYCKIQGFVELAALVHPDDWPKLVDTLKKM